MFGHSQPIPQWGLDAYKTHTPDYAKDAAAVILYDEYLETVDAQGRAVERERYAMRVLKPQGRSEVTCAVSYGEDEKINYFRVWTIAADEKQYQAQDTDFTEKATPASPSCSPPGRRALPIPPPSTLTQLSSVSRRSS
jgi:hypothetical protein